MPKKSSSTEKKFVYCFQAGLGFEPPFLAELVSETPHKAVLKSGKKTVTAHRAACSTTPFTQADLDKYEAAKPFSGATKDGPAPKATKPTSFKGFFS